MISTMGSPQRSESIITEGHADVKRDDDRKN